MTDIVDLREQQRWLMIPKTALDVLAEANLSSPGDLPVKEAGERTLAVTEGFLAKILLNEGRSLGTLFGYRREIEKRSAERSFREGIEFAVRVLRRFANSPEDTEEWRKFEKNRKAALDAGRSGPSKGDTR